jgi:hypothetical protein
MIATRGRHTGQGMRMLRAMTISAELGKPLPTVRQAALVLNLASSRSGRDGSLVSGASS